MVKFVVAIDEPGVRFPPDAKSNRYFDFLLLQFYEVSQLTYSGAFITQAFCNLLTEAKYSSFVELISATFGRSDSSEGNILTSLAGKVEQSM